MADEQPTLDPEHLVLRFRERVPSSPGTIDRVVDRVVEMARDLGCGEDEMTDMGIASREALANAIIHGNEGDSSKTVLVSLYCEAGKGILIAVRDEGPGFDPAAVPDPTHAERIHLSHGRGLFLMRQLMDHVEHRDGGREIRLYKRCPPPRRES